MLNRRGVLQGSIGAALAFGARAYGASPDRPGPKDLVAGQIKAGSNIAGIVAVVIEEGRTRLIANGHSGTAENPPLAADTVFEIGSITKILTALVLADMCARGEVALSDPVAKYLPESVHVPELQRPITLVDLATYTSGLPTLPGNLQPDWRNPYVDYTVEKLYAFLSGYQLKYAPGTHYAYANLAFGLLGVALARRAGQSFEDLVIERVCKPLNLSHTRITLTSDMRSSLAQGHGPDLKPAALWDHPPAVQGAGAFFSTPSDMTAFLKACLGLRQTSLSPLFSTLLQTRRPTGVAGSEAALGWFVTSDSGDEIVWKSGLSAGFQTNIAFSTRTHRGSVVLANGRFDVISLGLELIINPGFHPGDLGALLPP